MKARHFYLVCCVLGLLFPYSQFVSWLLEHGLNITLFCRELFRQSNQLVFCNGCNTFCNRAALVYSKRRQTFASATSVVADDWNIDRRRIFWIAAVSFFKTGDVGSNNCS